jgi:hypothetical protein
MLTEQPALNKPDTWVGTVTLTVTLTAAEKEILEAIVRLGSFAANDTDYPEEIDRLAEREFLHRERVGETVFRGRGRGDGTDIYRPTEIAKAWLQTCKQEPPADHEDPE